MFTMLRLFVLASCVHACTAFVPSNSHLWNNRPVVPSIVTESSSLHKKQQPPSNLFRRQDLAHKKQSSTSKLYGAFGGLELSNVFYDSADMAFNAWEWTANLGAPAALVAGAVLVTLSETREEFAPKSSDKRWVRIGKLLCRFLLATSFGLEVVSIFVSTVTGSVLLGHGEASKAAAVGYASCLGLLQHHHEFEFLTIQIGFLQGLLHWLGSVALELFLPKDCESTSARRMNVFLASCLGSLCIWILAFYNHHLNFYSDYAHMLRRYGVLFFQRYIWTKPFRPLSLVYGPSFLLSLFLGWRAFTSPPTLDED
mmetsp:Transcript_19680/g.30344  ORF Transcript_19680/g.30344 Transcript_19680/m.30344 type:complete len:312 (-) Transcript_19680:81-1016(-)